MVFSFHFYTDPLIQILVDSSRQILYTRSKNNTITVSYHNGNIFSEFYGFQFLAQICTNNCAA